jgi:acyl-CoA thioesterase-1
VSCFPSFIPACAGQAVRDKNRLCKRLGLFLVALLGIGHTLLFMNKLKLSFWLVLFLGLVACGGDAVDDVVQADAAQQPATEQVADVLAEEPLVILALGDSLTEGLGVNKTLNYPAVLERELLERGFNVKVVNSGLSGETSSGLKSRLDWVLQLNPDLTILNIGANDAMRGLPLELTQGNIEHIIEKVQGSGSQVVLAGMQIYDNLGQEYVAGFKDMYPEVAKKHDLVMIPFFLEHVAGDAKLNQDDMIHPTAAGYEVIVKRNVLPVVLPVVEQLAGVGMQP